MIDMVHVRAKVAAGAALAWAGVAAAMDRVRRSFVALVSSPAVWLAVVVVFVGAFWLGHIEGAVGKRVLRSERDEARRVSVEQGRRNEALAMANREALIAIARLKSELSEAKAAAAPSPAKPPPAVKPRRPVRKPALVTKAARPAPVQSWSPFGDR